MTRPFDLVVLDLDGTILDLYKASSTTPAVRAAIAAVQAAGIPVSIATGRTLDYVRAYVQPLMIVTPVVTTQGAVIGDPVTGEVLAETTIGLAEARELAQWADSTARPSAFYVNDDRGHTHILENLPIGDDEFYDHVLGGPRELVGPFGLLFATPPRHLPVKYMIFSDIRQEPTLVADLHAHFGDRLTVTRTHPNLVELTAVGIDKGQGVLHLCGMLGVNPERVLAMGDADNDIPLLQAVGFGVAMGNATAGLKQVADWIAPSIDDDGAAVALETLVLGRA